MRNSISFSLVDMGAARFFRDTCIASWYYSWENLGGKTGSSWYLAPSELSFWLVYSAFPIFSFRSWIPEKISWDFYKELAKLDLTLWSSASTSLAPFAVVYFKSSKLIWPVLWSLLNGWVPLMVAAMLLRAIDCEKARESVAVPPPGVGRD